MKAAKPDNECICSEVPTTWDCTITECPPTSLEVVLGTDKHKAEYEFAWDDEAGAWVGWVLGAKFHAYHDPHGCRMTPDATRIGELTVVEVAPTP